MFGDDVVIGSLRAQSERLRALIDQMEKDEKRRDNGPYYAREMHEIEKCLKMIRKGEIELAK